MANQIRNLNHEFQKAVVQDDMVLADECLRKGANVDFTNIYGETALHQASRGSRVSLVKHLLDREANPNFQNKLGDTPLHYSCKQDDVEVIEALIKADARINTTNYDGRSAVHTSAEHGKTNALDYILFLGGKINLLDNKGNTPLHLAVLNGHEYCVECLLENRADIRIQNEAYKNPFFEAVEKGHTDMITRMSPYADIDTLIDGRGTPIFEVLENKIKTCKDLNEGEKAQKYEEIVKSLREMANKHRKGGTPSEIKRMSSLDIQSFKEALKEGTCLQHFIRLMMVGHWGAGKTTLTYALLNTFTQQRDVDRTEGIKIHSHRCKYDTIKRLWSDDPEGNEKHDILRKLTKFLFETTKKIPRDTKEQSEEESVLRRGKSQKIRRRISPPQDLIRRRSEIRGGKEINTCIPSYEEFKSFSESLPGHKPSSSHGSMKGISVSMQELQTTGQEQKKETHACDTKRNRLGRSSDTLKQMIREASSSALDKSEIIPISIWDFAGQSMFYRTHQAFLSFGALYTLVFDVTQHLEDTIPDDLHLFGEISHAKVKDFLEFWVNSIVTYAQSEVEGYPKIILVGTHIDKIPQDSKTDKVESYFESIRELFKGKPAEKYLIIESKHSVSSIDPGDKGIQNLKETIIRESEGYPNWTEEIPASWIAVDEKRMRLKEQGGKVVTFNEFAEYTNLIENCKLNLYLRFHHARGDLVYFSEDKLDNIIILDPQWITNILTSLITAENFIEKDKRKSSFWRQFNKEGVLEKSTIYRIWSMQNDLKENIYARVLNVMEKMDLVASVKIKNDEDETLEEVYYLPCLIKQRASLNVARILAEPREFAQLVYTFRNDFFPPAIFYRLVTKCIRVWAISSIEKEDIIDVNYVGFNLDKHHRLLVVKSRNRIFVKVRHKSCKAYINRSMLVTAQKFITSALHDIVQVYNPVLNKNVAMMASNAHYPFYMEVISCEGDQTTNFIHCFVKVPDNVGDHLTCPVHGKVKSMWFQTKEPLNISQSRQECPDDCQGIPNSMLQKRPTEQEIGRLSRRLGSGNAFHMLGINLNMRCEDEIDPIRSMTSRTNYPAQKWFFLLRKWMRKPNATYAQLKEALEATEIDFHKLCEIYMINPTGASIDTETMDKIPSDKLLKEIAQCIGQEAIMLGVELGIKSCDIERIQEDTKDHLSLVQQMLLFWKEKVEGNPTIRSLAIAMEEVESDRTKLIELSREDSDDDW